MIRQSVEEMAAEHQAQRILELEDRVRDLEHDIAWRDEIIRAALERMAAMTRQADRRRQIAAERIGQLRTAERIIRAQREELAQLQAETRTLDRERAA
jgi:hypothetical protein